MAHLDYLALGMGNQVFLHDGDACANIRGYAVKALEECTFSVFTVDTTTKTDTEGWLGDKTPTFTPSGGAAATIDQVVDGNTDMFTSGGDAVKIPAGVVVEVPVTAITLTTGACIVYTRK